MRIVLGSLAWLLLLPLSAVAQELPVIDPASQGLEEDPYWDVRCLLPQEVLSAAISDGDIRGLRVTLPASMKLLAFPSSWLRHRTPRLTLLLGLGGWAWPNTTGRYSASSASSFSAFWLVR